MKTKRQCLDEVAEMIGGEWGNCEGHSLAYQHFVFWFDGDYCISPHAFSRIMDWMTHNPNWTWGIDSCGFFMQYTGGLNDE